MNSSQQASPKSKPMAKNFHSDAIGFQRATTLGKVLIFAGFGLGFGGLFGSLFQMMRYHSKMNSLNFLRWQQRKIAIQSTMLSAASALMLINGFQTQYAILLRDLMPSSLSRN